MREISPNLASLLALAAEYVPTAEKWPVKYMRELSRLIKENDNQDGDGVDIFNALRGKKSSESAKKTAQGILKWAKENQTATKNRRTKIKY